MQVVSADEAYKLQCRLEKTEAERDALASFRYRVAHYVFRYRGGHFDATALADAMVALDSTKPTTSLARLKAKSHAEALENAVADGLQAASVDDLVDMLRKRSVACRRQAEGGE